MEDPGAFVDEGGEADLPFVDDDFGEGAANDNNQDSEGVRQGDLPHDDRVDEESKEGEVRPRQDSKKSVQPSKPKILYPEERVEDAK